jgi:cytochrome c biogenesis protein CcdA/glutaredoxin
MQRWIAILCGLLLFASLTASVAAEECVTPLSCPVTPSTNGTSVRDICVYYFYGQSCPHCARIKPFIDDVVLRYPRVQIFSYEIYFNATNQELFRDFITRYEISQEGVPALFIGDRALIGENAIGDNLEENIQYFYTHDPICPTTYIKNEGGPHDISPGQAIDLTVPSVIGAAIVDSINPCAFAVLIFLLVYLTSLQVRTRMLMIGMAYILSVFTVYFLSGMGFFALIQTTGLTSIVFNVAAIIAILAGIINLKDFFWYGRGISLSIPESRKESIKNFVMKASIPSAIILGGLVSMFELPCTGGIYLAILGLLSSRMTLLQGIPYLLIYNVIFILPLLVILFGVCYGVSPKRMESWRGEEKRWMRFAMGVVMICLGVLMLTGVL